MKAGNLLVRSRTFHHWKKRMCKIQNASFEYYNLKNVLKGKLVISTKKIQLRLLNQPKFGFMLSVEDTELYLSADSSKDLENWINGIKEEFPNQVVVKPCDDFAEVQIEVEFPNVLKNGDALCGIGKCIRRVGWIDEVLCLVAMYVDADCARDCSACTGFSTKLDGCKVDQVFYDSFMAEKFRKTFVFTSDKKISKSVLIAMLQEELTPRLKHSAEQLRKITDTIEKPLKKGESMTFTCYSDESVGFQYKGNRQSVKAAMGLGSAIQAMFFDVHSIQSDAKIQLMEKFPLLKADDCIDSPLSTDGVQTSYEELDDASPTLQNKRQAFNASVIHVPSGNLFPEQLTNRLGLVGICSPYHAPDMLEGGNYALGLYTDRSAMSANLIRYKGLSAGSLVTDRLFCAQFVEGSFTKCIAFTCTDSQKKVFKPLEVCIGLLKYVSADEFHSFYEKFMALVLPQDKCGVFLTFENDHMSLSVKNGEKYTFSSMLSSELQNLFFGYDSIRQNTNLNFFQHVPTILDRANDEQVQTFYDEVAMLRENRQRQDEGSIGKVGYLFVSQMKRKGSLKWVKRYAYFVHQINYVSMVLCLGGVN